MYTFVGKSPGHRLCDTAVVVLREGGNRFVMWGDVHVLHDIADRHGWKHEGPRTPKRVIRALSQCPGVLIKSRVLIERHWVLKFALPKEKHGTDYK